MRELGIDLKGMNDGLGKMATAKRKDLKSKGKGNTPNKAEYITFEMENEMWARGALGDSNPTVLLHSIWYLSSMLLGFRGQHEARQLKVSDFVLKQNKQGRHYRLFK